MFIILQFHRIRDSFHKILKHISRENWWIQDNSLRVLSESVCRCALTQFHYFAVTEKPFSVVALSYSGLLTVLCKFCLRPTSVAGKKANFSLHRPSHCLINTYLQCTLTPSMLQKCSKVSNGNTGGYIFTFMHTY